MSLKDIEKLREKVEKDPNSKLFIPLAEEYRKEGMLDDAVNVLLEGISRQPGYMSARVSLGKIYLEKGMPKEARVEFESVVKTIPDNLYAHKKLAEIYRDAGETDLAMKSYRTVLNLNAMDEEAMAMLNDMEGRETNLLMAAEQAAKDSSSPRPTAYEGAAEDNPEAAPQPSGTADESADAARDEDFSVFKNAIFGDRNPDMPDNAAEEVKEAEEVSGDVPGGTALLDELELELIDENTAEGNSEDAYFDLCTDEATHEAAATVFDPSRTKDEPADTGNVRQEGRDLISPDTESLIVSADQHIASGDYPAAMNIYRKVLTSVPDDRKALQRVEELKLLLKLMGKDKEYLVARLTGFLDGIRKKHDGLSGSP